MGKAASCIKMIELLNSGRKYKVSELAEALETNPRNLIEYKKELEEAGYYIESVPGRYGGYKLDKNYVIPALKLTSEEKESLIEAYRFVMKKNDFMKKNQLSSAIGKIASSIELPTFKDDLLNFNTYQLSMKEDDIDERYKFIDDAINDKHAIKIEYNSLKNGVKEHILHPYKLFIYNNSWFFLALNPEVGEIWYFKLNRIIKWEKLEKTFTVLDSFNPTTYFDENGFRTEGDFIHVELIAKGIRKRLFKERIYGNNQVVTDIDESGAKVSFDLQNEDRILSLILQCGEDVVLKEPEYLVNKLKDILKRIYDNY